MIDKKADILVVEDSPVQAELLRRTLSRNGYEVRIARNGEEGLASIARKKPDLVISDIEMPTMNGYEMCSRIKNDEKTSGIPILVLTSFASPEDVIHGLYAKVDNYLTKPYEEGYLLQRIEHLLMNYKLQEPEKVHAGVDISLGGKKYTIDTSRRQVLDLLISTYENAVQQKRELEKRTEELEAAKSELQENYRKLKELEVLRDNLTHMIVHDMRSPLTGVTGYLKILQSQTKEKLTAQEIEFLERALSCVTSLTNQVNSVLDVSKLEAGKMELNRAPCKIDRMVHESLEMLGALVHQVRIFFLPGSDDWIVSCDPDLIRRVIVNLVANAIKFTPRQGEVQISLEKEGRNIKLSVSDTGIGIPPEYHEKIFQKFGQVQSSAQKGKYSTGLGLAFCKLAVEAHGGQIGLVSEPGKGSTFWFRLPSAEAPVLGENEI